MSTVLPLDSYDNPIPALRLRTGGAHAIAASASSARNATAFDTETKIVSVYATGPVYLKFGTSSVTAANTDHYFPAGIYYDFAIDDAHTHLAVLRAENDCTVYVSERI